MDRVIADVLPDGKEGGHPPLQAQGEGRNVGDGINDAPALTRADAASPSAPAPDSPSTRRNVVLMKSRLSDVPRGDPHERATVIEHPREPVLGVLLQRHLIPLAIGSTRACSGWSFELKPVVGAVAMSFSSVTVLPQLLRLNLFRLHDAGKDRPMKYQARLDALPAAETTEINGPASDDKINRSEDQTMTKTMKIEGMMCAHCEARVKKALEAVAGVAAAEVSHEAGTAVLTLQGAVDEAALKKAVEDAGYTCLD